MRFAEPHWLMLGIVAVAITALFLIRSERLKSRALGLLERTRLRSPASAPSPARRWMRVVVSTFAVAMGFVALARPQKGMRWETMERNGVDLLLVVDTSKSMDADDVKPTRLERSKLAIHDLVERFPGDRIGLVAFAGDAFVQSPMTLDHAALLESVDALDTQTIAHGGTDIGRGIDVAAGALASEPGRQKVMVVMSDGEDLEGRGLEEAKAASAAGITIDTVGVGTAAGELVPARDAHGQTTGLVLDAAGKPVRSHLDEAGLQAIAAATRGAYRPLGADGRGLDALYDSSLATLTHAQASSRMKRVYAEWFQIPLALALAALVVDGILGRRWRGLGARAKKPAFARTRILAGAATALVLFATPTPALASVETAAKAYAAGRYDAAATEFEKESERSPKDARLAFNAGDAAYRAGHFDAADAAFKRALTTADPKLQQQILYNEGDVLYRTGAAQKPEDREQIIANWKSAVEAYDGAIALTPTDADAIYNRDLVKRKIKALEEQPKPESKPNDPKDDKKDDKGGGKSGDPKSGDKGGEPKDDKGGAKSGEPKDGKAGHDPARPEGAKGTPKDKGDAPSPSQSPSGAPSSAEKGDAKEPRNKGEGAEPGHLSARDARALLGALRGDERHGVSHGTASAAPTDDTSGKDW